MTSKINLKTLFCTTFAASTEQTRYYLNGVYVEIDANGVTYVATDGKMLLATREELPEGETRNTTLGVWIISTGDCKAMKPGKRDSEEGELTAIGGQITVNSNGTARTFKPIDGTYPNWRHVVPGDNFKPLRNQNKNDRLDDLVEVDQFDPALLSQLQKFSKAMGFGEFPMIHHGETGSPAPVSFTNTDNSFGVIMPLRPKPEAWAKPIWASNELEKAQDTKAAA